jgi:hypothetical protein
MGDDLPTSSGQSRFPASKVPGRPWLGNYNFKVLASLPFSQDSRGSTLRQQASWEAPMFERRSLPRIPLNQPALFTWTEFAAAFPAWC